MFALQIAVKKEKKEKMKQTFSGVPSVQKNPRK